MLSRKNLLLFMLVFCSFGAVRPQPNLNRQFLDCLWDKEASKRLHPPDGDNGQAIGPYQIWRVYWIDAVEYDPSIGGTYENCRDKEYAEKIVIAYMRRYAPANATYEQMARIHNGGPKGHRKSSTLKYWQHRAFDPLR